MNDWLNLSDDDVKVITSEEDLFVVKANNTLIEIPNNATNGEVIRALFPQAEVKECYKDIYEEPHLYRVYKLDIYPTEFTEEFWNAPYKKGENK